MTGARSILVVTGSRADFGLLLPVIRAALAHPALSTSVVACGSHLLPPAETWRDVQNAGVALGARIEMQRPGETGRFHDARAVGRGIDSFASLFERVAPDWVVVLGDRIEAFAAGAAAAIAGVGLAHLHAGDRAEGIVDESMRHALSRLAHLHLAASPQSAARLLRSGEEQHRVQFIGSPAIDALRDTPPLDDEPLRELDAPSAVLLLHPAGLSESEERAWVRAAAQALAGRRVLVLSPNFDAGREWVLDELQRAAGANGWPLVDHLPRGRFVGLLKRLALDPSGVIVGNSSAALIEAAALRLPAVNIGPRQGGRERPPSVIDALEPTPGAVARAIGHALALDRSTLTHPYGDGRAGERAVALLAEINPHDRGWSRKRCAY